MVTTDNPVCHICQFDIKSCRCEFTDSVDSPDDFHEGQPWDDKNKAQGSIVLSLRWSAPFETRFQCGCWLCHEVIAPGDMIRILVSLTRADGQKRVVRGHQDCMKLDTVAWRLRMFKRYEHPLSMIQTITHEESPIMQELRTLREKVFVQSCTIEDLESKLKSSHQT